MKRKVIKVLCCITVALILFAGCGKTNTENEIESTEKKMEEITEEKVTEQIEEEKKRIAFTDKVISEEATDMEGPYFIRINRTANIVEVFSLGESGETKLVKTMLCSVGLSEAGGDGNETPLESHLELKLQLTVNMQVGTRQTRMKEIHGLENYRYLKM